MSTIGTATNSSPYLAAPAAAAIENGKNHFVTLGENGVSLATAGASAVGILLPDTEDKVAAGECVTVQIKDRTLIQTGGAITAGDPVASDATGCAVKAEAEKFALAMPWRAQPPQARSSTSRLPRAALCRRRAKGKGN